MADVLNLTDGTTTIDFIGASSDYSLLDGGLELSTPSIKRITGGETILREGERLQERQFGNREIEITFKIEAADHDALIDDIRDVRRLLDIAKQQATDIFSERVTLNYALENASDTVVFDVLDGELDVGNLASPLVKRSATLLEITLTLLCKPYARLASPIRLINFLRNPGFDWNPGEGGRDALALVDFTGGRLESTTSEAVSPLAAGLWFNADAVTGTQELMECGGTTYAWRLRLNGSALEFHFHDGTADRTLTAATTITTGRWFFVSFTQFKQSFNNSLITVLMLDEAIEDTDVRSGASIRTPSGTTTLGAGVAGANPFNGKIAGAFYVSTIQPLFPFQLSYIYRYGIKGLAANAITSPAYWGLDDGPVFGIWPFDETAGDILDTSGNDEDLTVQGSVSRTAHIAKPGAAWTKGSSFNSSLVSGLYSDDTKHGLWCVRFNESSGDANMYIQQNQISTPPPGDVTDWTLIFNVKSLSGASQIKLVLIDSSGTDTYTITGTLNTWDQYIITRVVNGALTVKFLWDVASATDILIDSIDLTFNKPFGTFATPTKNTGTLYPYVGGTSVVTWPNDDPSSSSGVPFLDIHDIPGDAPATCRVYCEGTGSSQQGPIRLASVQGKDPWKQVLWWRMAQFIPAFSLNSTYESGKDPDVTTAAATALTLRIAIPVHKLFPFTSEQFGTYKAYIGVEGEANMTSILKLTTSLYEVPLSGDPIKDGNTQAAYRLVDAGLFSWPPAVSIQAHRDNLLSSRERTSADVQYFPRLEVHNIADAAIAAPNVNYGYLFLLPTDDGFVHLQPDIAAGGPFIGGLQLGEELVVDTIDEDAVQVGYLSDLKVHGTGTIRVIEAASSAVSVIGTGFLLKPQTSGAVIALISKPATNSEPFGQYTETEDLWIWIEYMPRFLYV